MGHILSELSPMTRPSWVALHGMAYSFIELDKAVVHVIRLVCVLFMVYVYGFYSVCSLMGRRQWHHAPVLLPGKSHGQRSLVGCSPWGR